MTLGFFVIFAILFGGIFFQLITTQSPSAQLNSCAIGTLGNAYPTLATDCFKDKSSSIDNCCFMHAKIQGVSINWCYPLPKTANIQEVESATSVYGKYATVQCSSSSISLPLILIALFGLFML